MSSGESTVSVILPTHNRAKELPRSIQSVLSQSFQKFELIIVDDASNDNTEEVVKNFFDRRIRYISINHNVGGAEARNIGIHNSKSNIIAFQDSDDEWLPLKLEKCLFALEKSESIGVYSGFWQIYDHRARYMPFFLPGAHNNLLEDLLWGNFIDTPTAVVKRESLISVGGFDKEMKRYQDWELFLRLSRNGPLTFIDEPLILSHFTPNSISSNLKAHQESLEIIYHKNKIFIDVNKKLKAAWHARIGDAQMRTGSTLEGRKNLIRSIFCDPLNMRYITKTIFSLPASRYVYVNANKPFEKSFIK